MARKRKQKHGEEEEGGEEWLLPYSDLMTLLLAVFIVLFAVSKIDASKAKKMSDAFSNSMMTGNAGLFDDGGSQVPIKTEGSNQSVPKIKNPKKNETKEGTTKEQTNTTQKANDVTQEEIAKFLGQYELKNLEKLKSKLDIKFKNKGLTYSITTRIDMRGLVISLNNTILFDPGSTKVKKENEGTLMEIAKTISTLDNYIRIEGHTDNIPIHTSGYPSNWELSTDRAASVVRLFINKFHIPPEKLEAVGYGENRPVGDNATEKGRAQNRRIDIIILSEKYNNLEK